MSVGDQHSVSAPSPEEGKSRRTVLGSACGAVMVGTLVASYGTLFSYAGRFLYPAKPAAKAWMFVIDAVRMKVGDSLAFKTPGGARVAIARQGEKGDVSDFIALSSVCPHLGCQVHWEGQNNRFFCPCHNGAFDPSGKATSGPPADAGQSLPTFPLKLENGLLFIEVETETLAGLSPSPAQGEGWGEGRGTDSVSPAVACNDRPMNDWTPDPHPASRTRPPSPSEGEGEGGAA